MNKICVCGAGTMGSGIAQVAAAAGFSTLLYDVNENMVQKAREKLESDLDKLAARQKITTHQKEEVLQYIRYTHELTDCIADVIIEAVVERPEVKVGLFQELAALNTHETLFASNTS